MLAPEPSRPWGGAAKPPEMGHASPRCYPIAKASGATAITRATADWTWDA
jgi:hypothetical protein